MQVVSSGTIKPFNYAEVYRNCKNKYKTIHDDEFYASYIENAVSVMFEFDEKIYRAELFDRMLRDAGMAALIKTPTSDYTPVWFTPIDLDSPKLADGFYADCVCFDFWGKEYKFKKWEENPDILVFFNNPLRTPDMFVSKYATMLSDIDMSILNNVHYSRQHPIPVARDKQTKARIDECIKSVTNGETKTVLMENSINDILGENDSIDMLNLTEVEKSQYLQYLSHLHDSMISRLYFLIGLGTTDNGKQAQITTEELNKNDDASITQALAWYKARKDGFDVAKEKGHDLSFDFHPVWKQRIERIINPPESVESTTNGEEENSNGNEDSGSSDENNVERSDG
jgi:hypothetical protein